MGCFSCFDSRGDEKPISQKVGADRPEVHPTSAPSNISRLPSGVDRLKTRSNVSLRRESSGPKDNNNPYSQIAAHTFTLRELAAATNNFSPDCFLGEGGFGPVYRGRLPGTGQWIPELRHYAPGVPIILVGTKLDLRDDKKFLTDNPGVVPITTAQKFDKYLLPWDNLSWMLHRTDGTRS